MVTRRVAIVGSRPGKGGKQVAEFILITSEVVALVASLPEGTTVVSGGAQGVDSIAAAEARARRLRVVEHLADWNRLGRGAGIIRNGTIVDDATEVHAFPSSWSRGTWDTIEKAKRAGKLAAVYGPFEVA